VIERIVGIFIPPACREEVLGDLRERNDGVQLFIYDALRTVPFVIVSRVRRTTDSVVLLMEAFCCYVSFLSVAWVVEPSMAASREGLLRLAIPGAIALFVLVVADAYANPKKKSVLRPVLAVALAFAVDAVSPDRRSTAAGARSRVLAEAGNPGGGSVESDGGGGGNSTRGIGSAGSFEGSRIGDGDCCGGDLRDHPADLMVGQPSAPVFPENYC
jgi:hypothetical protein